jgi:cell division protein FtsW
MANPPTSLPRTTSGSDRAGGRGRGAVVAVKNLFVAESGAFYTILGVTLFLVVFGVVMVLSSSSVEQYAATHDFFGAFTKQGMYAVIGIPLMLVASRLSVRFWRKWAMRIVIVGVIIQAAVVLTPLGYSIQGNRNWIRVGSFTAQPSEFLKLALVLGLGAIMYTNRNRLDSWKAVYLPVGLVVAGSIGLVLVGHDQGTAMIMALLVLGCLFVGGARLKHLGVGLVAVAVILPIVTMSESSRSSRISAWLSGCTNTNQYQDLCWQPVHGMWALASGGIFGVGLGNSKAKWSWLPEADNDFIFAIIGEELGLIGAVVILALFVVLAIGFMRVIRTSNDPFVRTVTGGVLFWVLGQALVNIAVVLGLLPVLGVPLPLISAGGSALIMTLIAIGVVLSFAREIPGRTELTGTLQTPAERSAAAAAARASAARDARATAEARR